MTKAVVILGAGSSVDFGIPTLQGVFQSPAAQTYLGQNTWLHDQLNKIFWEPRGIDIRSAHTSLTIEEMLTILRDWKNEKGVKSPLSPDDTEKLKRSLYILIKHCMYKGRTSEQAHLNPLIQFCKDKFEHITWATFNWDCMFESSYYYWSGPPELQGYYRSNPHVIIPLENWRNPSSTKHLFLKLHGGINWWLRDAKIHYVPWSTTEGGIDSVWSQFEADLGSQAVPVILEPSYYKYTEDMYEILKPQWDEFGKRLYDTDYIIIVGYSLPEADSQARSKIITSFQANENGKWLVIDSGESTIKRYVRLLGNKRLETYSQGLNAFNGDFDLNMKRGFPELFPSDEQT